MRTTIDLDDDILEVARSLAAHQKRSIGRVISDMARKSLEAPCQVDGAVRNGVRVIQRGKDSAAVTLELVNKLRDEV